LRFGYGAGSRLIFETSSAGERRKAVERLIAVYICGMGVILMYGVDRDAELPEFRTCLLEQSLKNRLCAGICTGELESRV
jgi:hypothetical protein